MKDRGGHLSKRNPNRVETNRYNELKNFCFQYNDWKKKLADINYFGVSDVLMPVNDNEFADRTFVVVSEREKYKHYIDLVEQTAKQLKYGNYIMEGITTGLSYDKMTARYGLLPLSRKEYYKEYREFFHLLDLVRD